MVYLGIQFFFGGAKNSVVIDRESGDLKTTPKFENAVKMGGKLEIMSFFSMYWAEDVATPPRI